MKAPGKPPTPLSNLLLLLLCIFVSPCTSLSLQANTDTHSVELPISHPLLSRDLSAAAGASGSEDFSCGPGKPCSNSACCGKDGWCGFGDTYCGDGCQSNCHAKADCGKNAAVPGQTCPLNVCCSEFGFCGTTSEFCGKSCQSNCEQPKPSSPPTDVRKRVIGYWEAWNYQHPCGTMDVGSIPMNYLTHLIVSFGYIDSNFRITNMDGISSDIYRSIGELKALNPGLKIMIALGGWTFNDPGPWQSVFPTMVSSQANRATFIRNLLGFLAEYGYDGVDFDWEYPGAKDRGGSDKDGKNYTALLKELRQAIESSGRNYISTFTAPTSYWYLRHFDIKNMSEHVDWINLMSYDLHGVWDGENPIGKHVLSHTNLTEIDLALDLFWRVDVKPSSIVLGLGFYGRSFTLASSSCWKPGCRFTGPGAAGPCTGTAGILSYKEIKDILQRTGATSYLDKAAAARYFVYDSNSWISYDDPITIKAKIDYANNIGLSGVMIWAVDQDDSSLESLRAVSDPSLLDSVDSDFDLVDLKNLFPQEYLPAKGSKPKYGLVTFGGSGATDPTSSPFGFLLVSGDSHVVSSLRKRDGEPEPFVFLDCPEDVLERLPDEARTARVTCVSGDLDGCYQIMERGIEGTIVEMPESCAPNQLVRAISLTTSRNQSIPDTVSQGQRSSQVFDFTFDFNFKLVRRDSNNTSIRMDYSNTPGYWDQLVDSPGIQSRDLHQHDERFFAPINAAYNKLYNDEDKFEFDPGSATKIKEDISAPLFWQTVDGCEIDGRDYSEGIGAFVEGNIDASFYYGFTLIGTLKDGHWDAKQSHGFLQVRGESDITYGVGGIGTLDVRKSHNGNPISLSGQRSELNGHTMNAGHMKGFATFRPYYKIDYKIGTFNGTDYDLTDSSMSFNGRLNARVKSDFGKFQANFPIEDHSDKNRFGDRREKTQIELDSDNVLYGTMSSGGAITLGTQITFGMNMEFALFGNLFHFNIGLPNLALSYNSLSTFTFRPSESDSAKSCMEFDVSTDVAQVTSNGTSIGWDSAEGQGYLVQDVEMPSGGPFCFKDADTSSNSKRAAPLLSQESETNQTLLHNGTEDVKSLSRRGPGGMPGWGLSPGEAMAKDIIGFGGAFDQGIPLFDCVNCQGCRRPDETSSNQCCGCVNMQLKWGFKDIPSCTACDYEHGLPDWKANVLADLGRLNTRNAGDEEDHANATDTSSVHRLHRRKSGISEPDAKRVSICGERDHVNFPYKYPPFPQNPTYPWEGIQKGKWDSISRYWGNSTGICTHWGAAGLKKADQQWVEDPVTGTTSKVRADYQTEHVFEGQIIGDFFSEWLDKGQIRKQNPVPPNPTPKVPCSWTKEWIREDTLNPAWKIKVFKKGLQQTSFAKVLLSELGSQEHMDRLTIFQTRPNRKKGNLFTGVETVDKDVYKLMSQDEQLQALKELGLVFNYLNHKEVWPKYCAVYEAIYDHFGDFDTWYSTQNGAAVTIPSLQKEWKEYNRVVLDSMVRRARATATWMYENKNCGTFGCLLTPSYVRMWSVNHFINFYQLKIANTCNNMDKSTV